MQEQYENISQFLGCTFHLDCFDDLSDEKEVLLSSLEFNSVQTLELALRDLRALLEADVSELELRDQVLEMCDHDPTARGWSTMRSWLEHIATFLIGAINRKRECGDA